MRRRKGGVIIDQEVNSGVGGGSGIWYVRFYVVVYRQSLVVIWHLLISFLGFNNYSLRPQHLHLYNFNCNIKKP